MKETYKEGLMLLVGLVLGLAIGGLLIYMWKMDVAIPTSSETRTTETSTADTTVKFDQFDFSATIPSNWYTTKHEYNENDPSTTTDDGMNSELAVKGPEGTVRFLFDVDGLGGGPCAGTDLGDDVTTNNEIDITTEAGAVTLCHRVTAEDVEMWSSGGNFVRKDVKYLELKNGKPFVILGQAVAPSAQNRTAILNIMKSVAFK